MTRLVRSGCALAVVLAFGPATTVLAQQTQHRADGSAPQSQSRSEPGPGAAQRWFRTARSPEAALQRLVTVHYQSYQQNSGMTFTPADQAVRIHLGLPADEGLIVTSLQADSPATAAGIQKDDILLRLGEDSASTHAVKLSRASDLEKGLRKLGDGPVSLVLVRAGQRMTIKVQPHVSASLGPVRPEPPAYWIGIGVSPIEPVLRSQLKLSENLGVMVVSVDPHGPAAAAGVREFDILLKLDGTVVVNEGGLMNAVQSVGEKTVPITLLREGQRVEFKVTPARRPRTAQAWSVRAEEVTGDGPVIVVDPRMDRAPSDPTSPQRVPQPGTTTMQVVLPSRLVEGKSEVKQVQMLAADQLEAVAHQLELVRNLTGRLELSKPQTAEQATDRRLDELAAQIKDLRRAIDALANAQKSR